MSQSNIRYTANPNLNFNAPPTGDRLVTWASQSAEFTLTRPTRTGLPVIFAANADNTFLNQNGEYQLYSAYTNSSNNTTTNLFGSTTHIGIHVVSNVISEDNDLNIKPYLDSWTSGSIEILPERQDNSYTGGRFEIRGIVNNGISGETVFQVNILMSSDDGDATPVQNDAATITFKGTSNSGDSGGSNDVGEVTGLTAAGNEQLGVFSQTNDGTETIISASSGFTYKTLANASDDALEKGEFRFQTGSDTNDLVAVSTTLPFRLQATHSIQQAAGYPESMYPTVGFSYDMMYVTRSGNIGVGQHDFMTITIPNYIGSGSYIFDDDNSTNIGISGSCNALKIEHVATDGYAERTQYCTHFFAWNRDDSGHAQNLVCNSTENVRVPNSEVIIDPRRTTGSWDSNGNLVLSLYCFTPNTAQHNFRVMTL